MFVKPKLTKDTTRKVRKGTNGNIKNVPLIKRIFFVPFIFLNKWGIEISTSLK